jgi:hypothetical protein
MVNAHRRILFSSEQKKSRDFTFTNIFFVIKVTNYKHEILSD